MDATHPVKAYRDEHNLTQDGFADLIGVTRTTVARWETDGRKIDTELLPTITAKTGIPAKVLRPDLAELLRDEAVQ